MRGVIYYEASNYQQAELFFRKILSLNSKTVGAYINLANTLKTLDRGPEAEKLLQKAQELDPKNGLVYFALGTLYLNTELIKLPGLKDMDRLKMAKINFETAQQNWTSKDDIALAKGYIRTTDDAIETLQAMLDAEALFGTPSDDEGFGDDEFSDDGSFDDSGDSFKVDDAEDDSNAFKVD
jgi:tetratricopeptide (TPR) repeat protein